MAASYRGKHTIKVLQCPNTEHKGMVGMNAHLNWMMDQTEADIFIIMSADDLSDPRRAEETVKAFKEHQPSIVLTGIHFVETDGTYVGVNAKPSESCFVTSETCIAEMIGGSTSIAWTREFFDLAGPLPGVSSVDMYMPFLGIQHKGTYYLHQPLLTYIRYADPDNTGLEGVMRAADDAGKFPIEELMHFQVTSALFMILACMMRNGWNNEAAKAELFERILERSASWVSVRHAMTLHKINPIPFKV